MSQDLRAERYRLAGELFHRKDYAGALAILDELIAAHPKAAPLHYHRSRCLNALGRPGEAAHALDAALALAPDHVPTLLARVELAEEHFEELDTLPLLRRAITREPDNATALFHFARTVLDQTRVSDSADSVAEALRHLDRSIELDPQRAEAWARRGQYHHLRAHDTGEGEAAIRDALGMSYDRPSLELALSDLRHAAGLREDNQYDRLCARIAALLDRHELSVEHMDRVLARLPADAPARGFVQEERDRYARGKEGEREELAELVESAAATEGVERNMKEDMEHALSHATAQLVRQGMDLQTALESLAGDDSPEGMQATQIAFQLYNIAHEADPDLTEVDPAEFPAFQRKHAEACEKALAPLGYTRLACAEARGVSAQQGQRSLLGLFTHPEYGSAAAFAARPRWPGLFGFLFLLLTGQWKTARMLECGTRFEDGFLMNSRAAGPDPFDTSGIRDFSFEKLPPKATPRQVAERHIQRVAERLAQGHSVVPADSLEAIEDSWRTANERKREYRKSIGYATDKELRALLGKHYEKLADPIRDRLKLFADAEG